MSGYVPRADGVFNAWQGNFEAYLYEHYAELGLTAEVRTQVRDARLLWDGAYSDHHAAQQAAAAARRTKDDRRRDYDRLIREVAMRIQTHEGVTDAQRAALGISVRDTTPTPAPQPTTRPVVTVDSGKRLLHVIHFSDELAPTRKAKPKGAMGAEVWVKVGDPAPVDASELTFLTLDTRTPCTAKYIGADANKVAHYMLRWVNTRGQKGPWSETASATIGA